MKGNVRKKILIGAITIIFCFLLFSFTIQSNATTTVVGTWDVSADDGTSNVTATLYSDGSFIISGTGAMDDYSSSSNRPYNDYVADINTVQIQSGVTGIGKYAFYYCKSLISIEIPSSVTSIGSYAFESCSSLTSIEIPDSVTSIGSYAFFSCRSLTSIDVNESNPNYNSEKGVLFNKDKTKLICYPGGKEGEYTIPSSVTSIEYYAFDSCSSLTSIEIPSSVTSIGSYAFYNCSSLTSIEIPEGVTSIESGAFYGCSSLISIEIPSSVTSIGDSAFFKCSSLTSINVDINNKNYSSKNGVLFDKDKTKLICYPAGKEETGYIIPEGVTSIGFDAFHECRSLTSIEMPEGVTSIGSSAFSYCSSLTSIEIPSSVTSIGSYAFFYCSSLTSIEIPESVTSIESWAFCGCRSLTSIEIPSSVTSIGMDAFYGAKLTMVVATGSETVQEMELPDIIKRTMDEEDILYTENDFTLTNCSLSDNKTKLVVDTEVASTKTVSLKVTEGALEGLTVVVVPSGTITYSTTSWTNGNVTAIIHVANGETIENNEGNNTYTFAGNGSFTFKYLTAEGEEKEATATVNNIDKTNPVISSVTGNPTQWTKENVTLTVTASDTGSGLATQAYSFDGGQIWQAENTKTYTENTDGIVIKVRDKAGNIATYGTINITNIEELTIKNYVIEEENGIKYIESIKLGANIQEVKENIETNGTVKVYKEEREITDASTIVTTGMTIKITWGTTDEETYTLVVTGDLNGDGQMGNIDLLKLVRYNAGLDANLSGAYLKAADIYKDGKYADNKDILKMARVLANLENL